MAEKLERLARLHERGAIDAEGCERAKERVLEEGPRPAAPGSRCSCCTWWRSRSASFAGQAVLDAVAL